MKTIRRCVASPVLRWEPAGPDQQYRVIVRNQDTGERQRVYDGFRTECRLPADLRLTPDQLAFRVMVRSIDDPEERFSRLHDYAPIPRIGDDLETPAPDLLMGEVVKGADLYRLQVKRPGVDRPLVDMVSSKPRFLLPPGQLRDGQFEYDILPKVRGRWRNRKGLEITPAMIAAADERGDRPVPRPETEDKVIRGAPASHAPGRPDKLAPQAEAIGSALLIAVDVTARPDLSPMADVRDVASRQWWSGTGEAALESVVLTLEKSNFKGLFLVDALAAEAMGDDEVRRLTDLLVTRGHALGLMVNPEPWRALSEDLAQLDDVAVTAFAHERYLSIVGAAPQVVSFGPGAMNEKTLAEARRLGANVVLVDRPEQLDLPAWMRWKTAPFAAYDDLVVVPTTMALSTPAHVRDRTVRHALNTVDAMAAEAAADLVVAALRMRTDSLITAKIAPLALLRRSVVRSAAQADAWNQAMAARLPTWLEAGWERSPHGFPVLADRDEIKVEMMAKLIAGLGETRIACVDPAAVFSPGHLRALVEAPEAFEPLAEQRRGPRRFRLSGVRRYDAAYRQALKADPV